MSISEQLREEIKQDIELCESYPDKKGSEAVYSELVAKYSVIDPSFNTNISITGKASISGEEFDYRPELKTIAVKLRMYLLVGLEPNNNDLGEKAPVNTIEERAMTTNPSIQDMLADDIQRCLQSLNANTSEEEKRNIYCEMTAKYDDIIPNLGNGLYQYYSEQHFYDPEVSGESLQHNLNNIYNKMRSYCAVHYSPDNKLEEYSSKMNPCNKIFIVHGHDNEAKLDTARMLESIGFEAIILHEQPDSGLTIIEKIEKYTDVVFAVILYTECDKGRAKDAPKEQERSRARQNVVFEHGYFIGKLGRNNVCALVKGNIETPGDIDGVIYVSMDSDGAWKFKLANNMKAAGLPVDLNKIRF